MKLTDTLKTTDKKRFIFSLLFYLCLILSVFYDLHFDTLLFDSLNLHIYFVLLDLLLPGVAIWALVSNYDNNKERFAAFLVFLFFLFAKSIELRGLISTFTYRSVYTIVCLMVAAKGQSYRIIAKVYVVVKAVLLTALTSFALTGVMPDLLYEEFGRPDRHSLGFTYPLYCSAHWFTLALVYCYVRRGALKIWDYALLTGVWTILFFLCKAQTASALLFLLIIGSLIRQLYWHYIRSRGLKPSSRTVAFRKGVMRVLKMSFLILMLIMIGGAILYTQPVSDFFARVPRISTFFARFSLGREGLLNNFPTILGRSFESHTDAAAYKNGTYFSVDSSYILIPIYFGIIGVPIFISGLMYIPDRLYKKNEGYTLILLSLFAILCTMEHRLFYVSYSIFWLMAFADLGKGDRSHEKI